MVLGFEKTQVSLCVPNSSGGAGACGACSWKMSLVSHCSLPGPLMKSSKGAVQCGGEKGVSTLRCGFGQGRQYGSRPGNVTVGGNYKPASLRK